MCWKQYNESKGQSKKIKDHRDDYYIGYIHPRHEMLEHGIAKNAPLSDPRYYAYYEPLGCVPLDTNFLDPATHATYQGEEMIGGNRCLKIEISYSQSTQILYWIDVAHGFLVRRREERFRRKNKYLLTVVTIIPRVQQSNGIWLPVIIERRELLDPIETKPGELPQLDAQSVSLTRITISNFKANSPIPASTFIMKWPVGTNITNTENRKISASAEDAHKPQPCKQKGVGTRISRK